MQSFKFSWVLGVLLLSLLASSTFAQKKDSIQLRFINEIAVESSFFSTDKLGQIYAVKDDDQLIKFNANGDSLFQFNNHRNGELTLVDATDPFNILLYYPEFMKVVTLDRTLSPTSAFDLYDLDIVDIPTIGMSNDNNIWIYDNTSFTLKKINRNGKLILESANLSFQLKNWLQPNFILERGNFVFVNDPEQGILLFDLFGNYVKTISILELTDFQVEGNRIIYHTGQQIHTFDLLTLNTMEIPLPVEVDGEDQVQVRKDFLFVKQEERILVFQF